MPDRRLFALDWQGGPAERHFRRVRPGVEELPWGTLDPSAYPLELVERARLSWTEAAYNEYCTAAAFADILKAMLECSAPVDLCGMASDFLADEILHVELTSRIAMELGGGAPINVDYARLSDTPDSDLSADQRANELILSMCCVAEAFSLEMLAGCLKTATHPLVHGVLEMIVRDEAPHGQLGWLYFDWAGERLEEAERKRLAGVALATIESFAPYWKSLQAVEDEEHPDRAHTRALGWMDTEAYVQRARAAMRSDVIEPLRKRGIEVDETAVAALLA